MSAFIELTPEGFPIEAAAQNGFGIPVILVPDAAFFVDEEEVAAVIAYSIPQGWLIAQALGPSGNAYVDLETDTIALIRREGRITVKAKVAA